MPDQVSGFDLEQLSGWKSLLTEKGVDIGGLSDEELVHVKGISCIQTALRMLHDLELAHMAVSESLFGPSVRAVKADQLREAAEYAERELTYIVYGANRRGGRYEHALDLLRAALSSEKE